MVSPQVFQTIANNISEKGRLVLYKTHITGMRLKDIRKHETYHNTQIILEYPAPSAASRRKTAPQETHNPLCTVFLMNTSTVVSIRYDIS
jgi:hypothetical protein